MLPILGWKIYYRSSIVSGRTVADWLRAPREGVQWILYYHDRGLKTVAGGIDEYFLPGCRDSKLGELIPDAEFAKIHQAVLADKDHPNG